MPPSASPHAPGVTVLLGRLRRGDRSALTELMEVVYPDLREVARALLRRERPGHVLQATALVNEAYIRLVAHHDQNWQNRPHFFGAAATLMRRILVDYARARRTRKRGGGQTFIAADESGRAVDAPSVDLLALDCALDQLEHVSARQARIVELRYFAGLSVPETAEALGMNARTVDRDWAAARVWLRRRLEA
jgi:RNA polymerase sigma factor (TIGR02999 family)